MSSTRKLRFLFAGGGTGGHLFPALAVSQAVQDMCPNAEFIFLGRGDKLESKMVPQAGFQFAPILCEGISRKDKLRNVVVLVKFVVGIFQSLIVCMKFKPDAALGTGAYISAAPIIAARFMGAKTVLLESNSYPGISTKLLERKADIVFLAYEQAKKFLRRNTTTVVTGNPIRNTIQKTDRNAAVKKFGLQPEKKTLVVIGGSLGAAALNGFIKENAEALTAADIQVILQTGVTSIEKFKSLASDNIKVTPFFETIQDAFSAGDIFICRAGASTISEIQALGVPVILVPSPNVTENHQFHNAKALEDAGAALLVEEKDIQTSLLPVVLELASDDAKRQKLAENVHKMASPDAAKVIASQLVELAKSKSFFRRA